MTVHELLPGADSLDPTTWQRRHRLLQRVLVAHVPVLLVVALLTGSPVGWVVAAGLLPIAAAAAAARHLRGRSLAAAAVSAGLAWGVLTLVAVTGGLPEARYPVFVLIGLVAVYRDRIASAVYAGLTVVGHAVGLAVAPTAFTVAAGLPGPLGVAVFSGAVVLAVLGVALLGRAAANEQSVQERVDRDLTRADAETQRRRFTADLLVNLARRNQSLLGRQIDIINDLERAERDPGTLAELFKLDHLAGRVRRNAENLLVLAGERPPRVSAGPVAVRDVVDAAIVETERLDRVESFVDDQLAVVGDGVAELTHLVAELAENAVRLSPPDSVVTIRVHPDHGEDGGQVLTVTDTGVGMSDDQLVAANALLADPGEVDLSSVSARLGLHVVARLAQRHDIRVSLDSTPGSGLTATVLLPSTLFVRDVAVRPATARPGRAAASARARASREAGLRRGSRPGEPLTDVRGRHAPPEWQSWWDPRSTDAGAPEVREADVPAPASPATSGAADPAGDPPPDAGPEGPATGRRTLRRRVPLETLAPQLRGSEPDRPAAARAGTAVRTLTRYQASRQTPVVSAPTEEPAAVPPGPGDDEPADAAVPVHG